MNDDRSLATTPSHSYHGMPVLKAPPWKWYVPAYLYVGGLSGASAVVGAAAQASGRDDLRALVHKAGWISTLGDAASALLLIADLGRPARFVYMLRVFRPTSAMNIGSWVLLLSGLSSGAGLWLSRRDGALGRLGRAAVYLSGGFGMALATYTGTLLANTAVVVWNRGRTRLPLLFGASALTSAASAFQLLGPSTPAEACLTRRLGVVGKVGEVAAMRALEHEVGTGRAALPLARGRSGRLWDIAGALAVGGVALSLFGPRKLAALLGTAGAITARVAVIEAGKASARDPHASFETQRALAR